MKKLFCTLLSAAAAVALLCGFTPSPQENSAGAGLITKTYETAEAISSLSVSDKYADVTVKADERCLCLGDGLDLGRARRPSGQRSGQTA